MASFPEAADVGLGVGAEPRCDLETEVQALRRQLADKNKKVQHLTRQLQAEKNANSWLDREKVAMYQDERDHCRGTSPKDDDDEDEYGFSQNHSLKVNAYSTSASQSERRLHQGRICRPR